MRLPAGGAAGRRGLGAAGLLAACGDDRRRPRRNPRRQDDRAAGDDGTRVDAGRRAETGDITTAQVPVGSGVIVQAKNAVVTQPTAGEFLPSPPPAPTCCAQLATVVNDKINCTCHNSQFSIADGSVVRGPATEPLPPKEVSVNGDQIFIG